MGRAVETFREQKTGANDIDLLSEWAPNDFSLGYVLYRRNLVDAIAWELTLETVEGDVVVVRAEPIWIGTSWFFAGPLPMRAGDKLRFKTTGAVAGEDHTAVILLRVGLH